MAYYIRKNGTNDVISSGYMTLTACERDFEANHKRSEAYIWDSQWRTRELGRVQLNLKDFGLEPIVHHYLHASEKQDDNRADLYVAYTEDEFKGGQDRQTRTRIGRYLKKFYPHLSSDEVTEKASRIAALHFSKDEIKFAATREEIRTIYERSYNSDHVHSCMAGDINRFSDYNQGADVHPVEIYAAGDLQLAYLELAGELRARVLVWPEKKVYGRIYGDFNRMIPMLQKLGYCEGSLNGAKLLKIPLVDRSTRYYAAPYIDGSCNMHESEDGEHFIVGSDHDTPNNNYDGHTGGYVCLNVYTCHITGKQATMRLMTTVTSPYNGREVHILKEIVDTDTTVYKDVRYIDNSEWSVYWWINPTTGERMPQIIRDRNYIRCIDGEWYLSDDVRASGRGYMPLAQWAKSHRYCEISGESYPLDTMVQMVHGAYWSRASFQHHGVAINGVNYPKWDAPAAAMAA